MNVLLCVLQPGIGASQSSPAVSAASSSTQERFYVHPRARSGEPLVATSSSASKISSHQQQESKEPQQQSSASSSKVANGKRGVSSSVERTKPGQTMKASKPYREYRPHRASRVKSNTDIRAAENKNVRDAQVAGSKTNSSH